ncbi:MAG: hypothetical protein KC635_18590 [Myxococcales bacterium]|nr:hypothetical protein [Myxococcales bacterium]
MAALVLFLLIAIPIRVLRMELDDERAKLEPPPEVAATNETLWQVHLEVNRYIRIYSRAPEAIEDLVRTGLMGDADVRDGWGAGVDYRFDGERHTICSAGPDHRHGTRDDICDSYLGASTHPTEPIRMHDGVDDAERLLDALEGAEAADTAQVPK